jgi:hypothetical protein
MLLMVSTAKQKLTKFIEKIIPLKPSTSIRNWYEIYPQLSIFFSEIMSKYTH